MPFDIKFPGKVLRALVLLNHEACRVFQHVFLTLSLVNLISKDTNMVFYLSVNKLVDSSNRRL